MEKDNAKHDISQKEEKYLTRHVRTLVSIIKTLKLLKKDTRRIKNGKAAKFKFPAKRSGEAQKIET